MIEDYQLPKYVQPTGAVIGLDVVAASQRTASALNAGLYVVANGSACHINYGDNTVTATASDALMMPGERVQIMPNQYVAVIKAAGSADSIIRFAACE